MIGVLIVDDHPLLRAGATAFIERTDDCRVIGEAEDATQAFDLARKTRPDVVLLDIQLKGAGGSGIELARRLRSEMPETKILVLTNFAAEPYVRALLDIGVEGYLLKDTPPREILDAIRMVSGGRVVFSKRVADWVLPRTPPHRAEGRVVERLTPKEVEVLQLLAEGASNATMAEALGVSTKAVTLHLSNIFGKLGAESRTDALVQALRRGYVVIESSDIL